MKNVAPNCFNYRQLLVLASPVVIVCAAVMLCGCHQMQPGETSHKVTTAWPLFDVEKSSGINPEDGSRWEKEKGDACCWLSTWDKEKRYDKDNFLIYRKEKSGFFPIWSAEVEETKEFKKRSGAVLIFPYQSYMTKE